MLTASRSNPRRSLARPHPARQSGGRDAGDRERLCRYLDRPALPRTRLEETPAGLIRVTFKRPWAAGTAGVMFTPLELVERLAARISPPRAHLVHYDSAGAASQRCGSVACDSG